MKSLPCWGWFDECDDVLAILAGIKGRVSRQGSTLPLFKPDAAKKRGEQYVALSLEIEGEDYSRIVIKNEIKEDGTVDPRVYYDIQKKEDGKLSAGFMYKAAEGSFFKVFVTNEKDSATVYNKREKLRKYLFGDIKPTGEEKGKGKEEVDDTGKQRADIANRIDNSDTRFYGRFIEPERLTDNYVDCAEFVYEVLTEQGFTGFPSGGCNEQSTWFKAKEKDGLCTTGTDVSKVVAGDIILWGTQGAYGHTGIVVEKSEGTVSIVNAGFQGCRCDDKWKTYTKEDENKKIVQKYQTIEECYSDKCKKPSIWKSEGTNSKGYFKANTLSSEDHVFGYWARPSLIKK